MAKDNAMEQLVTKFLLNTCQLCPPPSVDAVLATLSCTALARRHPDDEPEADVVPLATGSVAEFYIEPMLSCIGDFDIMFHRSTELAIPAGYPPPTQLPADFHSWIRLYEIIDSQWPGYVYLRVYGFLSECRDEKKYAFWSSEERSGYFPRYTTRVMHGPAQITLHASKRERLVGYAQMQDSVLCIRCLEWPPQATDWPSRHRKYGWPDSATVDRVVGNGCDVVPVAHRQCRQHKWEGKNQWRLSFSRAEVVLLNSWMPVQQIVYHMLRVFVKTERLTDSADDSGAKILSNYHIKTLMLWTCELKPLDWLTDDLNCVRICTTLLHTLAAWIRDAQCLQYFVCKCNLFDHERSDYLHCQVEWSLASLTVSSLSAWFINGYMRKCAQQCPHSVAHLFTGGTGKVQPENAVSVVVDWRQKTRRREWFYSFNGVTSTLAARAFRAPLTVRSIHVEVTELDKLDQNLVRYFIAGAFLHVARLAAASEQRCYEFLEVLTTICLYLNGVSEEHRRSQKDSTQLYKTATLLLKLTASKLLHASHIVQIELAKAYLQKVLNGKPGALCRSDCSLFCLSNVYLAALYYATGQYQTAADHCVLVTRTNDHTESCSHVVEAELLPKIDGDIDNLLGLAVFYQYVRTAVMNEEQQTEETQHVGVLNAKLFAKYLQVNCCIAAQKSFTQQRIATWVLQYQEYARRSQNLFISDVLLLKRLLKRLLQREFAKKRNQKSATQNALNLRHLLLQCAVEHLTIFRQVEARDFGSVGTIVTTDFEALYAYKCGKYKHCLQLCRQNVRTLIEGGLAPNVSTYPEFIQLMDHDIVSLVGLTLIVNSACRDDVCYAEATDVTQLTLSLYLLTQCQLKLRDSEAALRLTLRCIKLAQRKHPGIATLDHFTLRLIERKLVNFLRVQM